MKCTLAIVAALGLAACTPGAQNSATPVPMPTGSPQAVTTIDVNLTLNAQAASPYGTTGGYRAAVTTVSLGTAIRFINSDSFAHTASFINAGTSFPASSPFGAGALQQSGSLLSQGWTSGAMQAGGSSQTLIADQRGTYLFGCFFHYGSPMRGAIVVQ